MRINIIRPIAVSLILSMIILSGAQARASLAPSMIPLTQANRAQDLQAVQKFLEQKEVARHLAHMQMNSSDIQSRVGNLSDQELHQVALRIDQQNPGRDGGGIVVTLLVIGILALLFVYLLKRV